MYQIKVGYRLKNNNTNKKHTTEKNTIKYDIDL